MAQSVLIGLPYDGSSSFLRGAAAAPALIRAALHSAAGNPWSERHGPAVGAGFQDDEGDLVLTDGAESRAEIERQVRLVAPGVSHREPGGLSVREVLAMLHTIDGPIVGADIVEYNPAQDIGGLTAQVAAKLVKELAGLIRRGRAASLGGLP